MIRDATEADLPAIIAILAADAAGGHGDTVDEDALPAYRAAFRTISESPGDWLYVMEEEGDIIATFQLVLSPCLLKRGTPRVMVEAVHVRPDRRGGGIGTVLMQFAEERARALGAYCLELTSNVRRVDAHRFYRRLGYSQSHLGFKKAL